MTSQVIFKIDKKLKQQALKKSHNEGFPFASVLKLATKAFVDGRLKIDVIETAPFNVTTQQEIKNALNDIAKGKNLSPSFTSAKDAIKYLKA